MYGQTEKPRISCLNVVKNQDKRLSIGKPFKNTFIKLKSSKQIEKKFLKNLCFGKNVCLGYAKSFKDLKKVIHYLANLILEIGYVDKDGFYIAGRIKKFSKINSA